MKGSKRLLLLALAVALQLCIAPIGVATAAHQAGESGVLPGGQVGWATMGGILGAPEYDWWYGCTATSAGMLMGYYDRTGYAGKTYGNLVPGGVAEATTFGIPNPGSALANNAIASAGHIAHFYWEGMQAGYGLSGDDIPGRTRAQFDCLADFMGTSQDSAGNVNGGTSIYYWNNGAKLYAEDAVGFGLRGLDGMLGIGDYVQHEGYNYGVHSLYTQLTDNKGQQFGFTLANFEAEIDAGRPVLIHVESHTMLGYGYDPETTTIHVRDTWGPGDHTMAWGGGYSGLYMWGVTVLSDLTGGNAAVPEPCTLIIWSALGSIGIAAGWWRKRKPA